MPVIGIEAMKIDKKRGKSLLWILVGLVGAAAVGAWPSHAAHIQMALFTVLVFGPLAFGTWEDRHRPRFGAWVVLAIILHCGALSLIRSIFPFASILPIIPLVLIECVALFMLMLKLTGQSDAESR